MKIDKLTTEMAEYICDELCKYPYELDEEALEDKCASCKMGQYYIELINIPYKCKKIVNEYFKECLDKRYDVFAVLEHNKQICERFKEE